MHGPPLCRSFCMKKGLNDEDALPHHGGIACISKRGFDDFRSAAAYAWLRQMVQSGLVIRTVCPQAPPRVDDTLAELGYGLRPVLGAMRGRGRAYQEETAEPRLAQTRQ